VPVNETRCLVPIICGLNSRVVKVSIGQLVYIGLIVVPYLLCRWIML